MARAWRVVKTDYLAGALSGDGARRMGGRWNPPGLAALYASDSLALAMLEVLVHFDASLPMADYAGFELDIPEERIVTLRPSDFDFAWPRRASIPHSQELGRSHFVERDIFALRVPSIVVQTEHNYVINPAHRDFFPWMQSLLMRSPLKVSFDPRLTGQRSGGLGNKTL